jgi:hypothetical protein
MEDCGLQIDLYYALTKYHNALLIEKGILEEMSIIIQKLKLLDYNMDGILLEFNKITSKPVSLRVELLAAAKDLNISISTMIGIEADDTLYKK